MVRGGYWDVNIRGVCFQNVVFELDLIKEKLDNVKKLLVKFMCRIKDNLYIFKIDEILLNY